MISYVKSETSSIPTLRIGSLARSPDTSRGVGMPSIQVAFPYSLFRGDESRYPSCFIERLNTDYQITGRRGFMGDHKNDHFHVDAFACPVSSSFGPILDDLCEMTTSSSTQMNRNETYANSLVPLVSGTPVLVAGMSEKQHAAWSQETFYTSGTYKAYGSRKRFGSTYSQLVPLSRQGYRVSYLFRYATASYVFAYNAGVWHCIEAYKVDSVQALILELPWNYRASYFKKNIVGEISRSMIIPSSSSSSSWLSNWKASTNPSKFLTVEQVVKEISHFPADSLIQSEMLSRKNSLFKQVWVDLSTCWPSSASAFTAVSGTSVSSSEFVISCPPLTPVEMTRIRGYCASFSYLMGDQYAPSQQEHAQCAQDLADNGVAVDINSIALVGDLMKSRRLFSELRKVATSLGSAVISKNPAKGIQALSNVFLSYEYGARLTLNDSVELVSAVQSLLKSHGPGVVNGYRVSRTQYSSPRATSSLRLRTGWRRFVYKLYYKSSPIGLTRALEKLMVWDAYPSAGNLWDLVPLSFVVDWFVAVDDMCEQIDQQFYLSTLDIGGVVWSTKDVFPCSSQVPNSSVKLLNGRVVCYRRRLSSYLHYIPPQLSLAGKFNHHYPEATALIVQHR